MNKYEFTLVVKGSADDAKQAAESRGFQVSDVLPLSASTRIVARHELSEAAHVWLGEDSAAAPFPVGALLYFRSE